MMTMLACPSVRMLVQQAAQALPEAGLLASYWTTFIDRPEARWRQAPVQQAFLLCANIERELAPRTAQEMHEVTQQSFGFGADRVLSIDTESRAEESLYLDESIACLGKP
jgi:hypothetical protein